jgi:hypothetical protein
MRTILLTVVFLFAALSEAQEYTLLTWEDLKPKFDLKDPFKELNLGQLQNLGKLARYREKKSNTEKGLTPSETEQMKILEQTLSSQKIDYEYLFSVYPKVMEMRKRKNEDLNTTLDNTPIELSGYLLPLNFYKEKANEFLLVPWVGACIHTPPPPKNQIVYLKTKDWVKATELFEPVHITGILQINENTSELFLTDGTSEIITGYRMTDVNIFKL